MISLNKKDIVFVFALLICQIGAASAEVPFSCLNPNQILHRDDGAPLLKALNETADKIRLLHPELAASIGVGTCVNLPKTSALSIAAGQQLNLPLDCIGLTFLGLSQADMIEKAKQTVRTQDALIDGQNGAVFVKLGGVKFELPICMESFEGGGPQ